MEKKALGRGLSALIRRNVQNEINSDINVQFSDGNVQFSDSNVQNVINRVINVQFNRIRANPLQPREDFNAESIAELAQSIKEKGVIQPLLVRRKGDDYELIAGERRLRAAQSLGLKEVPVIVREASDQESLELALIENIQREDLNPIEEARAYQYLIEKFNFTQERLGEALGRARVSVTNTLRLLKLPLDIQDEMRKGRISFALGRALLEITDENELRRLAQEVIAKGLTVQELGNLIKMHRPKGFKRRIGISPREPQVVILEEELRQALATKVTISKQKKRGHIIIEFYSQGDLDRIAGVIKGGKISESGSVDIDQT